MDALPHPLEDAPHRTCIARATMSETWRLGVDGGPSLGVTGDLASEHALEGARQLLIVQNGVYDRNAAYSRNRWQPSGS
jgi:hypothetical protein